MHTAMLDDSARLATELATLARYRTSLSNSLPNSLNTALKPDLIA